MKMMIKGWQWSGALGAALLAGCGGDSAATTKTGSGGATTATTPKKDAGAPVVKAGAKHGEGDHSHGSGPHGGVVFDLGGGKYHAEFTVSHPKQEATIYILEGGNEKKAAAVKATSMLLNIKQPSFQVELKPSKQPGDTEGSASAFTGKHEKLGKEQEFEGTVSLEIDGKPYAGDFKEVPEAGSSHTSTTPKHGGGLDEVAKEAVGGTPFEKELYLKPGGIYTAADIKANGDSVPSVKFAGKHWEHADDIKAGDAICPVTNNKSEAACSWIVNGKKYAFCCNPCIDKFVKWAKTTPEKIKDPSAYVAN